MLNKTFYKSRNTDSDIRLAAALFLFLILLFSKGISVHAADSAAGGRKFLFVGDSYSIVREGVEKPWPVIFQEILGVDPKESLYATKGSYGFVKYGKQFADLVNAIKKDKSVTDIVIMGGIGNDWRYSGNAIRKKILDFHSLCRKKFPNARIVYGYCNWNIKNTDIQNAILNNGAVYKKAALDCGWIYLSGMETILRQHPSYFQEDAHHPTQRTQYIIANRMVKLYKKYCVSNIKLNKSSISIRKSGRANITATVYPSTAQNKNVYWTSSDTDVATVSKKGTVIAVGTGTCVISAVTVDGGYKAECKVKVLSNSSRKS